MSPYLRYQQMSGAIRESMRLDALPDHPLLYSPARPDHPQQILGHRRFHKKAIPTAKKYNGRTHRGTLLTVWRYRASLRNQYSWGYSSTLIYQCTPLIADMDLNVTVILSFCSN